MKFSSAAGRPMNLPHHLHLLSNLETYSMYHISLLNPRRKFLTDMHSSPYPYHYRRRYYMSFTTLSIISYPQNRIIFRRRPESSMPGITLRYSHSNIRFPMHTSYIIYTAIAQARTWYDVFSVDWSWREKALGIPFGAAVDNKAWCIHESVNPWKSLYVKHVLDVTLRYNPGNENISRVKPVYFFVASCKSPVVMFLLDVPFGPPFRGCIWFPPQWTLAKRISGWAYLKWTRSDGMYVRPSYLHLVRYKFKTCLSKLKMLFSFSSSVSHASVTTKTLNDTPTMPQ